MIEIKEQLLDIENIKNSKKPMLDLFIRRTSVITQTPEDMVDLIIRDQWGNASKETQMTTDNCEFDFTNLGILEMSAAKSRKRIQKIDGCVRKIESLPEDPNPRTENIKRLTIDKYKLIKDSIIRKQGNRNVNIKKQTNEV